MTKIEYYQNGVLVKKEDFRSKQDVIREIIPVLKQECSKVIQSAGLDEATQQNAALGIYPPERCDAIKSYLAACRNEYLRCKELILAAQTNDEADAVRFLAPPVPEGM